MPTQRFFRRTSSKIYTHKSVQLSGRAKLAESFRAFCIRYSAVFSAVVILAGMGISLHASAATPHTTIEAEAFTMTQGSTIQQNRGAHRGSEIVMKPGSQISKRLSSDEAVSRVAVRAKSSGKCNGKWGTLAMYLDTEALSSTVIRSKKFTDYSAIAAKSAGSYMVTIVNTMPHDCQQTISIDTVGIYGGAVKKPKLPPFEAPNVSINLDTPTPTPTPTPSVTPTPSSTPTPTPTPTAQPVLIDLVSTCPNPAHTPGGPDGFGGCWPYEGNTGVPSGVQLYDYTGPCTITAPMAIDARTITCDLVIKAPVIITRSIVNGRIDADYGQTLEISDSIVRAGTTSAPAIGYANVTVRRTEVTGGQHSILCSDNCVVEDSWLHDQYNPTGGATHNNAYLSNGGKNHTVKHSVLDCTPRNNDTGGGCTADLSLFGDFAAVQNVTIDKNLFAATPSGGYCGSFGHNAAKPHGAAPSGIIVTNNVFVRGESGKCGTSGPVTSFLPADSNVWSNNKWDNGASVTSADE